MIYPDPKTGKSKSAGRMTKMGLWITPYYGDQDEPWGIIIDYYLNTGPYSNHSGACKMSLRELAFAARGTVADIKRTLPTLEPHIMWYEEANIFWSRRFTKEQSHAESCQRNAALNLIDLNHSELTKDYCKEYPILSEKFCEWYKEFRVMLKEFGIKRKKVKSQGKPRVSSGSVHPEPRVSSGCAQGSPTVRPTVTGSVTDNRLQTTVPSSNLGTSKTLGDSLLDLVGEQPPTTPTKPKRKPVDNKAGRVVVSHYETQWTEKYGAKAKVSSGQKSVITTKARNSELGEEELRAVVDAYFADTYWGGRRHPFPPLHKSWHDWQAASQVAKKDNEDTFSFPDSMLAENLGL